MAHDFDGRAETRLVLRGGVVGRPMRALLAEGEIAAKDGESGGGEGLGEGDEQRGLAVGAGAVSENEGGVGDCRSRFVEEAAHGRVGRGVVKRLHSSRVQGAGRDSGPVLSRES